MSILKKIISFLKNDKNELGTEEAHLMETTTNMSIERIANHEAAHGIVWYLFRNNWIVNSLTIERENLPDEKMVGALHITPNFNVETETDMERANEIFAIALAGMIGQNMNVLHENQYFIVKSKEYQNILDMFDTYGCSGDFDIVKKYLPHLGKVHNANEYDFMRFKIFDLVSLFQDHEEVQLLHDNLSKLLLEKGTLSREQLEAFFDSHNFSDFIHEEGLDYRFYHQNK